MERSKRKDGSEYKYVSYMCGTYAHSGKYACTIHGINEKNLISIVIEHIRTYALMIEYDEERIIEAALAAQCNEIISCRAAYQSELEAHKKQISKLDLLIENLYEDRVTGLVPESLFRRHIQKYEQDRADRSQSVKTLEQRIKNLGQNTNSASSLVNLIKQYTELVTLDRETLLLLIDKIIIGESQYIDGKRVCDVKIIYNHIGDIDRLRLDVDGAERSTGAESIREAVPAHGRKAI